MHLAQSISLDHKVSRPMPMCMSICNGLPICHFIYYLIIYASSLLKEVRVILITVFKANDKSVPEELIRVPDQKKRDTQMSWGFCH